MTNSPLDELVALAIFEILKINKFYEKAILYKTHYVTIDPKSLSEKSLIQNDR